MRCSFTSQLEHILVVSPVQKLGCQSNTIETDVQLRFMLSSSLKEAGERVWWGGFPVAELPRYHLLDF